MAQGNDRLDTIFQQLIEKVIIELKPCLIWLCIVPIGENPGPGDRGTEAFEAHLREQLHILLVPGVEVNGLMVGVVAARQNALGDFPFHTVGPRRHHICDGHTFSALVPAALQLVRCHRAAPEEVFG